ncbi:MAG: polyhydroxybutyrate depolymerase [Planctomycetaceae bacterium]|nr:polyhydroxybutyrate depolymerase [Planctomycetaceae bacterium]
MKQEEIDYRSSVVVQNRRRTFLVHLPAKVGKHFPLVVALHGTGIDGERMANFSGLNDSADEHGFVVAYPDGSGRTTQSLSWNIGHRSSFGARQKIDDVQFIAELIHHLEATLGIDRQRVYLTGVSSGAMLCYRVAQVHPGLVAAIGAVAGTMPECKRSSRAVPLIHFHGTADEFVPFHGGVGPRSLSQIDFRSVRESIDWWALQNACQPVPKITHMPSDGEIAIRVIRETHLDKNGTERVILYTIEGGGHTWPGRIWPEHPTNPNLLGYTTKTLSANKELWNFFEKFRVET